MNYDIKTIIRASNIHYGINPKGSKNMDFEVVRILLMALDFNMESDINEFQVFIYSLEPLHMSKAMVYGNIPKCFNCNVHAFDIDIDKKIIFIKSEVVNHE